MIQYLNLLKDIKEKGTWKNPARENMPRTLSLFGAQYRCNLSDGFPLLTTKKIKFEHIVTELLWFLRGDTNIKYLVDNGCNIWNEDAYNYYKKTEQFKVDQFSFNQFLEWIGKNCGDYTYGDCGWQYGRLWRKWDTYNYLPDNESLSNTFGNSLQQDKSIDQIQELITGLKNNPESRRHILTALNPAHYNDLALFPCHVLAQFNCRQLNNDEKLDILGIKHSENDKFNADLIDNCPKYYLDCHLYQRSCDVFLGVPYNTASYALLTNILSRITGMVAGDLIHTFGDVHIYENHMEQVDEQLNRIPSKLPELNIKPNLFSGYEMYGLDGMINSIENSSFELIGYNPQSPIKAKLSTGLK